jgi:hypothetical protein
VLTHRERRERATVGDHRLEADRQDPPLRVVDRTAGLPTEAPRRGGEQLQRVADPRREVGFLGGGDGEAADEEHGEP